MSRYSAIFPRFLKAPGAVTASSVMEAVSQDDEFTPSLRWKWKERDDDGAVGGYGSDDDDGDDDDDDDDDDDGGLLSQEGTQESCLVSNLLYLNTLECFSNSCHHLLLSSVEYLFPI